MQLASSAAASRVRSFSQFLAALPLPTSHNSHRLLSKRMSCNQPLSNPRFHKVELSDDFGHETTSFRLISYNILAQVYVKSAEFPHSPSSCLKWKTRSQAILTRLVSFNADILCLQELDEYEFYKGHLKSQGYESIYNKRAGNKRDGCGIFFKSKRLEIMEFRNVDYNDLVPSISPQHVASSGGSTNIYDPSIRLKRDCVAIMAAFKLFEAPNFIIIVANTHLYWDPDWADVKLAQAKYLVSRIVDFQKKLQNYPGFPIVLVAGDFNSTPGDQVYKYMVSNQKDVSLVPSIESSLEVMSTKNLVGVNDPSKNGQLVNDWTTKSKVVENIFFPLCSLYGEVASEPSFTNYTPGFTGTLDYIFFHTSSYLRPKSVLSLPSDGSMDIVGGLPNHFHPSDHLPIGADFAIK